MRSNLYIVGAIFVVIILVVYFGWFHNAQNLGSGDAGDVVGAFAQEVGDTSTWESYDDDLFVFNYPAVMKLEEQDSVENRTVLLTHWGPTQQAGTEFYDGIAITVAKRELMSGTVKEVAEADAEQSQEHGEILQPVTAIEFGGVNGWVYEFAGLGRYKTYFLPAVDEQYITITVFVADPQAQGFEEVKDKILDTFEIK